MEKTGLLELFCKKAANADAEIHLASGPAEALNIIKETLVSLGEKEEKPLKVVWRKGPLAERMHVSGNSFFPAQVHFSNLAAEAEEATVGIAEVDWAIADTGTLVHDATDIELRYVTTLPLINILLVRDDAVVEDMAAALAKYSPHLPPYLAMITGPSRTADIERVLTLGVHGPERLLVILVGQGGDRDS